jgi:quercetin dioxygenase-like cupin family protein
MAKAGEKIYNPVQGDWIVFRQTARDTSGELLSAELVVSPRGGNPLHVHPRQEEYFKAVSGTLGVQVGDEHRSLEEGEEAVVPPGTPHRWWNDTDEEAHVLVELRPALNTEIFSRPSTGLFGTARPARTAYLTSCSKRSHSPVSTRARSISPGYPYRYRRSSWQLSLRWGGCLGTKTTTRSTAQRRPRGWEALGHRPRRG